MRRQTRFTSSQPAMRCDPRPAGLFSDLRWLLPITLALLVGTLLSGPVGGAALLRNSDDRATALPSHASPAAFARGHILVGSKATSDDVSFEKALSKRGVKSLGKIGHTHIHVVDVAPGDEEDAVERLRADPDVAYAEVDRLIPAAGVTNDPMSGSEWHLATIGAPSAWTYSTGTGITIAILDTGVDATHPDLASKIVPGWNFYDNNSDTHDVNGHGTTVAGAAAAATNNSIGVASVAGGAKIMPIRIADPQEYALWSNVAQGITYAADHGARVVNLSYVGASGSATIQQAAIYLRSKGGVLYVAAGNTGALDTTAPTDLMMVVGATLQDDTHATWSTYGPFVDISAPGYNIVSTAPGNQYWYCWGTSLATPIVAATAALVLSKRPDFTPSQVDSTLMSTATDLGAPGRDVYFGAGRVNAAAALQQAAAAPPPSGGDTTKPMVAIGWPTGGTVGGMVPVSVVASDNVGVTRVELRVNGSLIGTDNVTPWQFSWNSAGVANGVVSLTATAYDAAGNAAMSSPVAITVSNAVAPPVDTQPPTVSIASPTGGTVSGSVKVSVNASDNVGVTRVDLLVNNTVVGTSNAAPYAFTWNTTAFANGSVTLAARAYDAAGYVTISSVIVNVSNTAGGGAVSDTTPPVVTVSSPTSGATATSSLAVKASASDNSGMSGLTMKLYVDGVLKGTVTGGSLSISVNVRKLLPGLHTVLVTATDKSGNQGSRQVQFTKK
jgi:subtilisin family serine protease